MVAISLLLKVVDASSEQETELLSVDNRALTKLQAEQVATQLWQAEQTRIQEELGAMWESREVTYNGYSMPFTVKVYGNEPANGRSLYISMHGGGNVPKEVNDQQYRNQIGLYSPKEGVYIAPRAAVDDWNMWFRPHVDTLFKRIIQCAILKLNVNPNRVYLLGYSAGGDGTYRMAPRLADQWAAASMMAGHPGEASPKNLRNIGFMVWMGEHDSAYNRNILAVDFGKRMDSLQAEDSEGYIHKTTIVPGCGHWMNRADTAAIEWLSQFERNPYPKRIVWRQEGSNLRSTFYNLEVDINSASEGSELVVEYSDNTISILKSDYNRVVIYLNDSIMDLSKPVTVECNGNTIFHGKVKRTSQVIANSISLFQDPCYIYSAKVEVTK